VFKWQYFLSKEIFIMARSCRAIFNEVQSKRRFACGGLYKFEEDEYRLSLMELELERIAA
jgi:hypothetical protein